MSKRSNRRILIDGTYLAMQMKGVGRYIANTLRELAELDSSNDYWILVREQTQLPPLPQTPRLHYIPIRLHNHLIHGFWTLPRQARLLKADLAWIPYETPVGIFLCPYLVVCHDVPPLISRAQRVAGRHVSPQRRIIEALDLFLTRRSLRNASVVFANSHFVGNWLHSGLGIPAGRVCHAPCAPGADFAQLVQSVDREGVRSKLGCPNGYVLIFSTGDRRENLDTALRVFESLIAQGFELNLVVAGVRKSEDAQVRACINLYAWSNRVRLLPFYGEDRARDLAEVYAGASVYLDLSLHEGFGMQVIEAMACGTPVVSSNRGALPEVAGDAALLVNPNDVDQIANAVRDLACDSVIESTLVSRGKQQSAHYTWRRTASTILEEINLL